MIWRAPQTSFRALAVRGDWIVDGHHGPIAEGVRGFLLTVADLSGKLGITLDRPTRSQITVSDGTATVVLDNPLGAQVIAEATPAGQDGGGSSCETTHAGSKTTITCALGTGEFEVRMFGQPQAARSSRFPYLGTILVNSR